MNFLIPERFEYLTAEKKIPFGSINLQSVKLAYLIDKCIGEYYMDNAHFPLNAIVLIDILGEHYLRYIEYLIQNQFIQKVKGHSTAGHISTIYRLIDPLESVKIYHLHSYILEKKLNKFHDKAKVDKIISPIPKSIRPKLIDDLYKIDLDFEPALHYVKSLSKMDPRKYLKNLSMVNKIKDHEIFYTFDPYGRLHTNFTNLKKEIRNKYLSIEGEPLLYLDIRASQPFFLAQLLKKYHPDTPETQKFIEINENGDFYQYFVDQYPKRFHERNDVKKPIYQVLFDENITRGQFFFKKQFPSIFSFIKSYRGIYKIELWEALQEMESDFIFNNVYINVIKSYPGIPLFTVHDSIYFQKKYFDGIKKIWDQKREELITRSIF
jgi:hypothetical protein